jgi:hypothetical protein
MMTNTDLERMIVALEAIAAACYDETDGESLSDQLKYIGDTLADILERFQK